MPAPFPSPNSHPHPAQYSRDILCLPIAFSYLPTPKATPNPLLAPSKPPSFIPTPLKVHIPLTSSLMTPVPLISISLSIQAAMCIPLTAHKTLSQLPHSPLLSNHTQCLPIFSYPSSSYSNHHHSFTLPLLSSHIPALDNPRLHRTPSSDTPLRQHKNNSVCPCVPPAL